MSSKASTPSSSCSWDSLIDRDNSIESKNQFTMVFIDFDDTLIPTTIHRIFSQNVGIDLMSYTETKTLQYLIIKAIDKIKESISDDLVRICVVSNANHLWMDDLLYNADQHGYFSLLGEYFKKHKIVAVSAKEETKCFLKIKFGESAANDMMDITNKETYEHKWTWKYYSFSSVISHYKQELNAQCTRIISFGDGSDEYKALKQYASKYQIKSSHIQFLKSPTIYQLKYQWHYIKNNMDKFVITNDEYFNCFDPFDIVRGDNKRSCSGDKYQIPAIANYFKLWMKTINNYQIGRRMRHIETACQTVYNTLASNRLTAPIKKIMANSIFINEEFYNYFNIHLAVIESVQPNKVQ